MNETHAPLAKSNHVIFAESAEHMRKYGAPPYMITRMGSLAELARTDPASARRAVPQILAGLPDEKEIK